MGYEEPRFDRYAHIQTSWASGPIFTPQKPCYLPFVAVRAKANVRRADPGFGMSDPNCSWGGFEPSARHYFGHERAGAVHSADTEKLGVHRHQCSRGQSGCNRSIMKA